MQTYIFVGLLAGFIVGLLLPVLFPVLLYMEIAMYQDADYAGDILIPYTSISSTKPLMPGHFIVAISLMLGGVIGWLMYLINNQLQRNKNAQ